MNRLLAIPVQCALVMVGLVMLAAFLALAVTTAVYERLGGRV